MTPNQQQARLGIRTAPAVASDGRLGTVSAAFYAFAYIGFGLPLLLAALSAVVHVTLWLAILAFVCVLLAAQQARAHL